MIKIEEMEAADISTLHYAVGLLVGLHRKYGEVDVVIYHDNIRVRIDEVRKEGE